MADTLDVLTLAEAKASLKIGPNDVTQDVELVAAITNVSRQLDRLVGPVVKRTITGELHDGCGGTIYLRYFPVASFTSVTEYQSTTPVVLTRETSGVLPDGYLADPYDYDPALFSGELHRRSGGVTTRFYGGTRNIAVTYVAGRANTTALTDAKYKEAARIILRNLWRADEQSIAQSGEYDVPAQNFPKFGIPNAARDLLVDELQNRVGIA